VTSLRGLSAWSKTDMENGWTLLRVIQRHPASIPANSETLRATPNSTQERSNSSLALLSPKRAGVNRMLVRKGMVSEANARGKATRYADRDPATWTVKVQVEVHML
jgi:hypothetical protein